MRIASVSWIASLLGIVLASSAIAQQGPSATANAAQVAPEGQLTEIVVTAQRREENEQHAAVPIDVLSGQAALQNGVTSVDQLGSLVPALTITPGSGTRSNFFIRGVGNFTINPIFASAIAFNYDGVYVGRPGGTNGLFYDLARIEVLEGPQGTLYGRNATGGAINVIPAKPVLGQFGGDATLTYGNYNAKTVEGALNMPLGTDAAVRLSGNIVEHSGYLTDGTDDADTKAVRIQLLYELMPELSVRLAADYASDGGSGVGVNYADSYQFNRATGQYVVTPSGLGPSVGLYDPQAQAYRSTLVAGPAGRLLAPMEPYQYLDNAYYGTNAEINYKASAGTLTIIPAWRYSRANNITDTTGFTAGVLEDDEQYSTEARFVGERVGPIDYTVGAFYYEETNNGHYAVGQQALANFQDVSLLTHSYAAFASLTGHITDALRLVGGVRYTEDRQAFNGSQQSLTTICTQAACPNAPLFPQVWYPSQLPPPVPAPGAVVPLIGTGAIISNGPTSVKGDLPANKTTYRGAVEYDVAPQSLLYASVETGFRSGGFNVATGYATYEPEYITAYTLGSKNRFLDNRLQLNLEGYYWSYRNQQLANVALDKAGLQTLFTRNLGDLKIYGLDTSAQYLLTPTTTLSAEVQYLHTKYESFDYLVPNHGAPPYTGCTSALDAANPTFYTVDCAGKPGFNSPLWTLNPGVQQSIPLGNYKLLALVDSQFRTSRYVGFEFQPGQLVGSTWTTNAQLIFGPSDDRWSVAAFVRNIENDRYVVASSTFGIGSALVDVTAPPRTYGVRVFAKF
jgi:iron complex outermembrane recepter protein